MIEKNRKLRIRRHHELINERKAKAIRRYAKGQSFENYVADLFSKESFSLLHDTRKCSAMTDTASLLLLPDFQFIHHKSHYRFWVECKFRSSARFGVISWSKDSAEFRRYKKFQEEVRPEKVYVIIGLIGFPTSPKFLYCIPLDNIDMPDLFINEIMQYRRNPPVSATFSNGRLSLINI